MKKRIGMIFILLVLLLFLALFVFLFINNIYYHSYFKELEISDVMYEELTFEKYEMIRGGRYSSTRYEIYFYEYDEPFEVSSFVLNKFDRDALNDLGRNQKIQVYYENDYDICQMKCGSITLLSFSDYKEENIENQTLGIIVSPILMLMAIFLISLFIYWAYNDDKQIKRIKNGDLKSELGKVKLECKIEDNIIQVYNFLDEWSLVINGNIIRKDFRIMKSKFCLKGRITINGKNKLVEAMMKSFILKLSFDGKVIKRKFFLVE
jgi:hypothetical protein